ncbi:MAG: hypothetical protein N2749_02425 [Clostridia bacterium]|nr:hypothetical protein [Clostridia bacterium]
MGRSYYVPRSVKGESRILYIFTIKSFITTVLIGLIGAGIWYIGGYFGMGFLIGAIITGIFGVIGYVFGAVSIPDVPAMGVLRKAGGENISDIVLRLITFRGRKKIYMYNHKRGIK